MTTRRTIATLILCGLLSSSMQEANAGPAGSDDAAKAAAVGERVPNSHSLRDLRGNRRALHDFKGHKALVIVFMGTDCPISNLYLPEVIQLEKKCRKRGAQFLAVYPNEGDDLDSIAEHAYDRDTPFLVLKDEGQKLADAVGVRRVPAVAVLDGGFILRYRGRVDDRYGVGSRRPAATRSDLGQALDEMLSEKPVTVPETEADGCLISRERKAHVKSDITYNRDVAAILQNRCETCHRAEQAAPFPLVTYEDAVDHGRMIREVTQERRMPPWHADPRYGHFANERRLSREEIDTLAAWVDAGMPEGDPKDRPAPVHWPEGWSLGKPDLVFEMPEEFSVPATGVLPYKNWVIDPKFTEDKWVRLAECRPGAPGVVHHVVVYIQSGRSGPRAASGLALSVLVGWAPGDLGLVCPPDTALRIPKGSKLRMELHYTPNGTAVKDRSAFGITFAKAPPKYEFFVHEFANIAISVPPDDEHYKAEATLRLPADARILGFVPHMHWRGKDFRYELIRPDGRVETVLSVPRWDFNWQATYRLREPLKLPKGYRLHAVAHWDNTSTNLLNPDPQKRVTFGLQSWEEMMVGWAAYVWERPETAAELAKNPPKLADVFFDRLDTNGDGVITADEIPEQMRLFFLASGTKQTGKMTRAEFEKLFDQMRKRMRGNRPFQGNRSAERVQEQTEKKPDATKNGASH